MKYEKLTFRQIARRASSACIGTIYSAAEGDIDCDDYYVEYQRLHAGHFHDNISSAQFHFDFTADGISRWLRWRLIPLDYKNMFIW